MTTTLDTYRLLGRSGLRVSPLSLGTMTFGVTTGWGTPDDEAQRMVDRYMDAGGNFIDTANFYGGHGGSERALGKIIPKKREKIVLATKYSLVMEQGDVNTSGNNRKNMVRSVEASLKRLNTDYIDLLYLHMWDCQTPVEEVMRAFDDLVSAGKIVYAGLSDIPAWQASRMQTIADIRGWSPIVALQIQYNLTERTVERDLFPMAREMGMGVLPWSPLAGGVLAGKYTKADLPSKAPETNLAVTSRKSINQMTGRLTEGALAMADVVGQVSRELNCSAAQVALAWTMVNPAVTSPILGVRTFAQLEDNLGALDVDLSEDQIARLNAVSDIEMGFPHDMLGTPFTQSMLAGGTKVDPRR